MNETAVLGITQAAHYVEEVDSTSSTSKEQLEIELADARLLHRLSIELIQEDGIAGLYKKIVEAAVAIMRSQYATIQMLYPEKGSIGKLRILACSGFTPEAEKYWEWVYAYTGSSCGEVLRTGKREVIPDYRTCAFMQGHPTLAVFLEGGILAAQSTPLYSRTGQLLGMISTHWNHPYDPPQRHLDLLDILSRQAADLIERTNNAEALRASEEEKNALLLQLETMVEERTKELKRSNEDLQQFAHVASHDLKEPVRKIRTFGLRLKNELSDTLNDNSRLFTEKILESASRMSTMIDGVLNYSSLNGIEQKMELLDLTKILSDIKHDLEVLIEDKGAIIHCDQLPVIEGDQVLIHQLFYNVINNSLKFSKASEPPVITISSTPVLIHETAYLAIKVSDNGIGFPAAYKDKIFDTFTRLNAKSKYEGTGLGLSLSKQIVERHKGFIEANGVENEGAVIIITLPVQQS
jgi:signal transduction histidine kinase